MLYNWFETENKIDVKPLKQTVKMAAEGTSREGGGHSCKGRKKPWGQLQPILVPISEERDAYILQS